MKKNFKEVETEIETKEVVQLFNEIEDLETIEVVDEIEEIEEVEEVEKPKVSIEEFCIIANKNKSIDIAIKALEVNVETYIPLKVKKMICKAVMNGVVYSVDGLKHYNNFDKDYLLAMTCIGLYTNLDLGIDDSLAYDMLVKYNLFEEVLGLFGRDYVECTDILESMLDEEVLQNNTIEAVMASSIYSVIPSINKLIDRTDPEKIAEHLGSGLEKIATMLETNQGVMELLDTFNKIKK